MEDVLSGSGGEYRHLRRLVENLLDIFITVLFEIEFFEVRVGNVTVHDDLHCSGSFLTHDGGPASLQFCHQIAFYMPMSSSQSDFLSEIEDN